MNLIREIGFDVSQFRNDPWQVCLVNIEPKPQFIAIADTIEDGAIYGDSATFISDAVYL